MRPVLIIVLLSWAMAALAPAMASAPAAAGTWELASGEFQITPAIAPPADGDPNWRPVRLVHKWSPQEYRSGLNGWYRLHLFLEERPREILGVYLWRLNMNAAVYLNGQYLGDGGRFAEPVARNWNRPLYFTIPSGLLRAGDNVMHIRLRTYPSYAVLAPVLVGPDAVLRPAFEWRRFLQNDVSQALFYATAGVGLFMLALWVRRRSDRVYLWFGLSMLAWSVFSLNMFIRDIPVPAHAWWWLVHLAIDTWVAFLALFVLRFIDARSHLLQRGLVVFLGSEAIALAAVDLEAFNNVASAWHLGSMALVVYLIVRLLRHARATHRREARRFAYGLGVVLLAGAHDWILQAGALPYPVMVSLWQKGFHLMHYTAPVVFLLLAWHLTGRFITALNESERLNTELEARVAANRRELEDGYRQLHALERHQAVTEERERIYRDLHDDVGAKLLSLVYRSNDAANADLARSALQDLRDVVSRTQSDALELEAALADWHAECDQRLAAAHIGLRWRQVDRLPQVDLSQTQMTNLGRILREAITNAIHHARPRTVQVAIDHEAPDLIIEVRDDGVGRGNGEWKPGRGLRNMELRARELGGAIQWRQAESGGCSVLCRIPLN